MSNLPIECMSIMINEAKKIDEKVKIDSGLTLTLKSATAIINNFNFLLQDSLLNNRKISLEKFKRKLKNIERGIDNDFSLSINIGSSRARTCDLSVNSRLL